MCYWPFDYISSQRRIAFLNVREWLSFWSAEDVILCARPVKEGLTKLSEELLVTGIRCLDTVLSLTWIDNKNRQCLAGARLMTALK